MMKPARAALLTMWFACCMASARAGAEPARERAVSTRDIPAEPLSSALADASTQLGLQLIYLSADAASKASPGARAGLGAGETLDALLAGTSLSFEFLNARTVRVFPRLAPRDEVAGERAAVYFNDRRAAEEPVPPRAGLDVIVTAAHVVHAPRLPTPLLQALPVTVGLCIPDELLHARLRRERHRVSLDVRHAPAPPDEIWELGPAAGDSFELMSRALFTTVLVLDHCNPRAPVPEGIQGRLLVELKDANVALPLITPAERRSHAQTPFPGFHVSERRATLTFTFSLAAPDDGHRVAWTVTGTSAAPHSSVQGQDEIAAVLAGALRNTVARAIVELNRVHALRAWFEMQGVTAEVLR